MAVVATAAYISGASVPMNHARIGYQSYVAAGTVTGTTEATNFEADATLNELTYDRWKPTALPATLTYDLGAAKTFDYIGIAAHTIGTNGNSIVAEYSTDNVVWNSLGVNNSPSDDKAIMMLFVAVSARYFRLTFSSGTAPTVGVVYCGQVLEMDRPFYSGHTPAVLNRKTVIKPNKSVNGQWVGRSILRTGLEANYEWKNITISWYETNIEPFSLSARTLPFFMAWNADEHSDHIAYMWTSDDIAPSLTGVVDLVSFGFKAEGIE
jgi:hypothetical protein